MEESFVKDVCSSLIKNHGAQGLKNVLVVIPSQRIGLHLKKEFASSFKEVAWLPEIKSIDAFVEGLSDLVPVDNFNAIFELYISYLKVFSEPDSFDTFLTWGKQILSDFSEVDKYLLESKDVFKNLKSIKEIEAWSFNSEELTDTQNKFLIFWEHLGKLYEQYNQDLADKGMCTKSNIYKEIAQHPVSYLTKLNYDKIYFIGFNALSKSEENIFKYLVNSKQGEMIWDADQYYVENKEQEAGNFIRQNLRWSNVSINDLKNEIRKSPKRIYFHGANSNVNQTVIASELLAQNPEFKTKKSALVFADENLLRPMLNVLPQNVDQMNVAMGYPLNASNSYSLLDQLFVTLKNVDRYRQKSSLYYKDFSQVFNHELIQLLLENRKVNLANVQTKINKENYTYLPKSLLESELKEVFYLFDFLFYEKESNVSSILESVITLFSEIRLELMNKVGDVIELEAISVIVNSLKKVAVVLMKHDVLKSTESLLLLVKQLLRMEKVSFYGEPLQGLQVLGLLETRGLDFENIILLSCNEEILPATSFSQSLMPFDLRGYFGLPSKEDKESMFAYYFYRLLQNGKNIHLIYNDGAPDGMSTNEISRYLLQISNELKSETVLVEKVEHFVDSRSIEMDAFLDLKKSDALKERVVTYLQQGLSASAINTFNKCNRDFFFNYLLRPNQAEEVEENIESSTYGTIIHKVLEVLYKKAGKLISAESVKEMQANCDKVLLEIFLETFPSENFKSGKNLLQYETAKYSLMQFLNAEIKFIQENGVIEILGLESSFEKEVVCQTCIGEIKVKVKGNIDRIDKVGNVIRIIDYKTGKVGENLVLKDSVGDMYSYALQLLVYLYLFNGSQGENKVNSGILSMKDISLGVQPLRKNAKDEFCINEIDIELIEKFEEYLAAFINDLLTSDYSHDTASKYCRFC